METVKEREALALQARGDGRMFAVQEGDAMFLLLVQEASEGFVSGRNITFDDDGNVQLTPVRLDLQAASRVMVRGKLPADVQQAE